MKRVTVLASILATFGFTTAWLSAATIVTEDWSGESLGDHSNQLTQWVQQGPADNATIINHPDSGVNHAIQLTQTGGFAKSNLNLLADPNPAKLVVQFDFTNTQAATDGAFFGFFLRDANPALPSALLYRLQWQGTSTGFTLRKVNTNLVGLAGWGSAIFADHSTHTVKMEITFDDANNQNLIELFLDGVSKGVAVDIDGVTASTPRLLPNATWSVQFSNFNGEATASNVIDNISITTTTIPEPAGAALLGLGGVMMLHRRKAG